MFYLHRKIKQDPLKGLVAAISVGMYQDEVLLDLCYEEDSNCQTDLNVVMTQAGEFIEIQGTAEDKPFTRAQSNAMLEMAEKELPSSLKATRSFRLVSLFSKTHLRMRFMPSSNRHKTSLACHLFALLVVRI